MITPLLQVFKTVVGSIGAATIALTMEVGFMHLRRLRSRRISEDRDRVV